jgi:tRNA threonylcarbamoyladenosine biosynthesis protein TsaE
MEHITKSTAETQKLGKRIGADLRGGGILALTGELGSGKTTFVQGLAKGLKIKQRIISPTFIIVRKYRAKAKNFYHVDLYRLEGDLGSEIENLGLRDIWKDPKNIVVIEWAEKIKKYLPQNTIWIEFENLGGEKRKIDIYE